MTSSSTAPTFAYVSETNEFSELFPHRYDFIFAKHPQPGSRPNWQTESRYPLADRLLEEGASLYGVRFGKSTSYCLLDIDAGSYYHPQQDALAVSRILATLEPLGISASICCTSSYSNGIHLYLPFQQAHLSWQIAIVLSTLLENAGFSLKPGQLEIFPNPKSAAQKSLFNAHRLPMQAGSYLLNSDFQPIWGDRQQFAQRWRSAQQHNDLDICLVKQILKRTQPPYRLSGKADKFIQDLNTEIESGWTDFGQTNRLLGRITMRCYIFQHILLEGEPLAGKELIDQIVATARSLPGYQQWCRHQHEIEKRAAEWASCIENSSYFPYGTSRGKFKPKVETVKISWNQQQSALVREKIRNAVASLLRKNCLPENITGRFEALTQCGIGGSSLYRHRDLWHPQYIDCLQADSIDQGIQQSPSLLSAPGRNALPAQPSSDFASPVQSTGCNGETALSAESMENDSVNDSIANTASKQAQLMLSKSAFSVPCPIKSVQRSSPKAKLMLLRLIFCLVGITLRETDGDRSLSELPKNLEPGFNQLE